MTKHKQDWVTTRIERFTYALYFIGQLIFNTIVASFTLVYLLNAGINEVVAGSILLLPKIWDAVNDTLFGVLVDRIRLKSGRFLPWIRLAAIGMPLSTIFFFSLPNGLPQTAQVAWVIVGYILWDTFYTICDTPIYALSTCITNNLDERTSMLSATRITGGIGGMAAAIAIPMLYGANGANLGWSKTAIVISIVGAACMLPVGFCAKERFHGENEQQISLGEMLRGIGQNRNLLAIISVRFLFCLTYSVEVLNAIFCQYVLGDETFASVLTMCISLPTLVLAAFTPALCRRFDKVHLYAFFMAVFAVFSVGLYFVGYSNTPALLGLTILRGIGYGSFSVLSFMFVPDCVEYSQYATGHRSEGLSFALQTFTIKVNNTLFSTVGAFIIAALGFSAANVTEQGKSAVWFAITLFSALGTAAALFVLFRFYRLRDRDVVDITACNNGQISRKECEERMTRRRKNGRRSA